MEDDEIVGLVKEEVALFAIVLKYQGQLAYSLHTSCSRGPTLLGDCLRGLLCCTSAVVPAKSPPDLDQLRLDRLRVENAKLRPHRAVEEGIGFVPCPFSSGDGVARREGRGGGVTLKSVRLSILVRGQKYVVVCL